MIWFWLVLGVVACSSSALFIKACDMDPALLGAMRLFMASVMLLPMFVRDWKRLPHLDFGQLVKVALPAGFFLAIHFISWNAGIRMTLVAHGSLIVNMVPVVLPLILWMTHREKVNRTEVFATLISIVGIGWLAVHDYHFSPNYIVGDTICFASMVLFALYLSFGRKFRDVGSIFLYIVPVYVIAATVCLVVSSFNWKTMPPVGRFDILMAFCLALIPTIFGHTVINYCMRHLRGQVVGIVNVGQFISAGFFAFLIFHELPTGTFYVVSLFVFISCGIAVRSNKHVR